MKLTVHLIKSEKTSTDETRAIIKTPVKTVSVEAGTFRGEQDFSLFCVVLGTCFNL